MRGSLKGIRARVDAIAAGLERRQGSMSPAELVRRLQAGRLKAPARERRRTAPTAEERDAELDETQATGRALRAMFRKEGRPFFQ